MTESTSPGTSLAYLRIAIAGVALGTWSVFVRPARIGALWASTVVFGGVAFVSALLVLALRTRRDGTGGRPRRHCEWREVLILGVLNAGVTLLYFTAMQRTDVSIAVSAHCLTPVFVAIAAPWVLHTPRQIRSLWFAVIGVGGVMLIAAPWRHAAGVAQSSGVLAGGRAGVGAALLNTGVLLLNKRLAPAFLVEERLAYPAAVAALLLFPAALWFSAPPRDLRGVVVLLLGAALIGVAGGWLFLSGLDDVRAEHAGILTLLEPVTGLLIAAFVWDERLGAVGMVGATITVLAGIFAIREPTRGERA